MAVTLLDPVAQTFIIDKASYPRGTFLSSIRLFFREKPNVNVPVKVTIVSTLNGYPTNSVLDYSSVSLLPGDVKVSQTPHYLDSNTYTQFTFPVPVYINPDTLYAIIVQSNTSGYKLWTAAIDDIPIASSVKVLPTDPTPSTLSKISKSPYIGSFFESQNGVTYTADQTKDMMFTIQRCRFSVGNSATVEYVVPQGLPQRKFAENTFDRATANVTFDQMNLSTTDYVPSDTNISYTYTVLANSDTTTTTASVIPGSYGTPLPYNIIFNDNKGKRVLDYDSNTSFKLTSVLTSSSDQVSPIIADDGVTLYTVEHSINNMGLSNSVLSIVNSGNGITVAANTMETFDMTSPDIVVSAPDIVGGQQAYVTASVVEGNIASIYVTTEGSGYTTTPTITFANTNYEIDPVVTVTGETSAFGGNGLARYQTYPVTLAQGNDSGDLRVYFTAYRPVQSDIHIYYKILAREDTQKFDDGDWQKMTLVGSNNKYSINRNDLYEYVAAPGTAGIADNYISYTSKETSVSYNEFYKYAIKVVMSASDSTFTPFLKDIRVLALPASSGL